MHKQLNRVVVYALLAITCFGAAVVFTESRLAFISVFSLGVVLVVAADLLLWHRLRRQFSNRA